jgi:hypothetical protein
MTGIATALLAGLLFGPDAPRDGLIALRWEARPILVFAAEEDPRLAEQIALLEAAEAELLARDNVVIIDTEPGSPLRARFLPADFTVILIGKDGGEKLRRHRVVVPDELNELIDTMPMRRREMERASQG